MYVILPLIDRLFVSSLHEWIFRSSQWAFTDISYYGHYNCHQSEKLLYHLCKDALQMFNYSEDDIRRAAEIREWLIKQISDKQEEVERLRTILSIIDNLLKQSSFRTASSFGSSSTISSSISQKTAHSQKISTPPNQRQKVTNAATTTDMTETVPYVAQQQQQPDEPEFREVRPLKSAKDNVVLANAGLSSNVVEISPAEGITLNVNTAPFKSFFLNRILEGMKTKDREKVNQGQIQESQSLNYQVEEDSNGLIKRIIINNYRENERINEILNTSTWVFTRMIEKSGR